MMESSKAVIAKVTIKILRSLIRILLRFEFAHSEFAELAKRAYVDVAYRDFAIPKRKQTYSRVAILTGLSRKDVVRLRELDETDAPLASSALNRATRVVGGWLRDPEFLDDQQQTKDIPLRGETGSFEALVARYSGDITARAVLDELVRVGAVIYVDRNTVHLASAGYIPQKSETEMLEIAGLCVSDLLHTSAHNIMDPQHARFQRQVVFRNIPASVAEEFQRYSRDHCEKLMLEFNTWLSEKGKSVELKPGEKTVRVGFGLYYFKNDD